MATHKLAILVDAIGAAKAARELGGVDKAISNIGSRAGTGLRTAGRNIAGLGAVATAGIALAVKTGLEDLATLESAVTSVDGAIKQVGLTGKTSGAQVAGWANEIESAIGAAFDDKDITAGAAGLIRYGKVTEDNLRPAMQVMTDLAARVGSVSTSSELLSKALADPTRAAGKLSRYGIILTKQQQKQIKVMVEAGDVAGAQALLLDELAKSTNGAAEASQGKYARSLSVLSDVAEDARKALAEGFLPVIEKVAGLMSEGLADPKVMGQIREFGKGLAGGLDDLIEIAKALPWGTIGDSLKLAGTGAQAVLGAFASLPPWVQTAVLTGWGLNKLTGGALSGIVGELGKGLIKGVLGMTAGVVNINAGVVNGGPGGVGGKGLGGKILGGAGTAAGLGIGGAAAVGAATFAGGIIVSDIIKNSSGMSEKQWQSRVEANLKRMGGFPESFGKKQEETRKAVNDLASNDRGEQAKHRAKLDAVKQKQAESLVAFRAGERATVIGTSRVANTTQSGTSRITTQSIGNTSRIVSQIARIPAPQTTVKVYVTAARVTQSTTTQNRYGSGTGSSGGGRIGGK